MVTEGGFVDAGNVISNDAGTFASSNGFSSSGLSGTGLSGGVISNNGFTNTGLSNAGTFIANSGASGGCPPDQTITIRQQQTQVQQVVNTVTVPQLQTQTVVSTAVQPQFVTRTVLRTQVVTRTLLNTRLVTQTRQQRVVSTVRLRDVIDTVTQTRFRTQVQTRFQTRTVVVTRQVVSTAVRAITSTRVVRSTVQVPQLVLQTSVVLGTGPAQTRVSTLVQDREVTSVVQQQPQTIIQTRTNVQVRAADRRTGQRQFRVVAGGGE